MNIRTTSLNSKEMVSSCTQTDTHNTMEWLSYRHSGHVTGAGETQGIGGRCAAGKEDTEGGTKRNGAGSPGCHEDPQDCKPFGKDI